jgi:hypothetical protein
LDRSYPVAKEYIDQFPKERTALIMRYVPSSSSSSLHSLPFPPYSSTVHSSLIYTLHSPTLAIHLYSPRHSTKLLHCSTSRHLSHSPLPRPSASRSPADSQIHSLHSRLLRRNPPLCLPNRPRPIPPFRNNTPPNGPLLPGGIRDDTSGI